MTYANHEELRTADAKVVSEAFPDLLWTCFDSKINKNLDSTSTSWYVDVNGKKFWAFVYNGALNGTSLY